MSTTYSFCPPSLLIHLQRSVNNLPWTSEESKQINSTRLIDEFFALIKQKHDIDDKAARKWLSQSTEKVSKTLQLNNKLLVQYEQNTIALDKLIEFHDELRVHNKRIFEEITQHHETLVASGYEAGVTIENSLKKYKNAANEMGKKEWVVLSNAWMESTAFNFFFETGAQRAYLKARKNHCLLINDTPLSSEAHFVFKEASSEPLFDSESIGAQAIGAVKPRLLDVGSCYNPFKTSKHANMFDVTGIDLCPANDSVFTCDFLTLEIGPEGSSPVTSPDDRSILLRLPAHSFEVITMSLVLNYLPSPAHRELMISNARKLLISPSVSPDEASPSHTSSSTTASAPLPPKPHSTGILLIVEKISIFDWKTHPNTNTNNPTALSTTTPAPTTTSSTDPNTDPSLIPPPSRHEWITCICDLGFELVTYQSNVYAGHHVHLFAFRVVPLHRTMVPHSDLPAAAVVAGATPYRARMRIKADVKGMDRDSRDGDRDSDRDSA